MRFIGLLTLIAASPALLTGCEAVQAKREVSYTVPWSDYDAVVVRTRNGSVDLSVQTRETAAITGTIRASAATIDEAERLVKSAEIVAAADPANERRLLVELRQPGGGDALRRTSASLAIAIPKAVGADVGTSNGSITVSGARGKITLDTGNARVSVRDLSGEVIIKTSNGSIHADRVEGTLKADTSNGHIQVNGLEGSGVFETSNGSIQVASTDGDVQAVTSNGSVRIDARPRADGVVSARSSNGSIELVLPRSLAGQVTLETSNGTARANFGAAPFQILRESKTALAARVNGGGLANVTAESSNANVRVEFR